MKILKINLSINTILSLVLIYPLILLFPSLLGYQAFFLTSPYFFLVFIFLVFILIIKKKIPYFKLLPIIISLLVISIINFSSLRYSLPIFYLAFIILVMFFLKKVNTTINMKSIPFFFSYLHSLLNSLSILRKRTRGHRKVCWFHRVSNSLCGCNYYSLYSCFQRMGR